MLIKIYIIIYNKKSMFTWLVNAQLLDSLVESGRLSYRTYLVTMTTSDVYKHSLH